MNSAPPPKIISEYQQYLKELYGASNAKRGSDYIYGYLSRSFAYLGKNIAINQASNEDFFRSLSWLLAFANLYEINMQQTLYSRFPGICPYCLTSPCQCFRTQKQPVKYIPAYKAKEEMDAKYTILAGSNHDWSLSNAIATLSTIYPNNEVVFHHAGPWHLIAKMQEEIGEVHEAASKFAKGSKTVHAIGEELSDALAWLLGAWGIVCRDRSMDDCFIDYYINDCPVCTSFPCVCADRAERPAELIDIETLRTIERSIKGLEDVLPEAKNLLQEIKKSVEVAAQDQSEPTTVHALKEVKGALEEIKGTVSTVDETGKKALSIINTITQLIDKIPWI